MQCTAYVALGVHGVSLQDADAALEQAVVVRS